MATGRSEFETVAVKWCAFMRSERESGGFLLHIHLFISSAPVMVQQAWSVIIFAIHWPSVVHHS